MQTISLNLCGFTERKPLHAYLKRVLDLPPYYGANLDALHSELVSFTEETRLSVLFHLDDGLFSSYIRRVIQVIEDSAQENPRLTVVTEQIED